MGNVQRTKKVNYEDIQTIINNKPPNMLLINTLVLHEQGCLIPNTVNVNMEEKIINENIKNSNIKIILYGKNNSDKTVEDKYLKLQGLGFTNIYIYPGGMFEWLLLQDIYGEVFKTTSKELDILKYKPKSGFLNYSLTTID
jgi:rhodanese-related sulfurtransferase